MKILIINDNLLCGGAEIFALNLKALLEKNGYETFLMTFDENFEEKISKVENKNNIINVSLKTFLGKANKLIFNFKLYFKIRKAIKQINPDKIIINNLFVSPMTQMKAVKGYDTYQVVHDYSVVCPKSICIKNYFDVCEGFKENNCIKTCTYHNSKLDIILKLYLTKRMEKIRKKYIKLLISPSKCLHNYLIKNGYNSVCMNNPMEVEEIAFDKEKLLHKNFIYVGEVTEKKGIFKFLEVFSDFSKANNVKIDIMGSIYNKEDEEKLKSYTDNCSNINYLGRLDNKEVVKNVRKAYAIVVPSIWMENYPTTVLEAQTQKTLVIGSNRGGIPDMLENEKGLIFDINSKESILKVLEKVVAFNEEEYRKIVTNAYEYVSKNNSYDTYLKKLKEIL